MIKTSKQFAKKKVTALCFSPDKKYCAVALKQTHSVSIYELPSNQIYLIDKWILKGEIKEQSQSICSLDWSISNKILSCSHDRSVVIWNFPITNNSKELVYSKNKLSIIKGVWSPNGKKFAISTSCKNVYVGYYETEQSLWSMRWVRLVQQHAFQSTVTSAKFHPSGRVLAMGSTDFTLKVVTCYLDAKIIESDLPLEVEDNAYKGPFANVKTFGEVLIAMTNLQGWVNDIAFSPSLNEIVVALHSNQLIVKKLLQTNNKNEPDAIITWKNLPFYNIVFTNSNTFVGSSFDNRLAVFKLKGESFEFVKYLQGSLLDSALATDKKTLVGNMKSMFEKSGLKNLEKKTQDMKEEAMPHTNIPSLAMLGDIVCSWDVMGRILFWKEE